MLEEKDPNQEGDHSRYMPPPIPKDKQEEATDFSGVKSSNQSALDTLEEVTHEIEKVATPILHSIEEVIYGQEEQTPPLSEEESIPPHRETTIPPPAYTAYQQTTYQQQIPQPQNNGLGLAGFILAIISYLIFWIPVIGQLMWLLGLIFSVIGMFKKPRGFAIAGLVLSLLGLIVVIILFFMIGFAALFNDF